MVAEPGAGRGRVGAELPRFEDGLRQAGFDVRTVVAGGEHVAARVRDVVAAGDGFVAAVGDDGTFHEAVNGWLRDDRPVDPDAVLALVAAGSGADMIRTFGLSQDAGEAAHRLAVGNVYSVDVVKATVSTRDVGEQVRYVLNHAQVGLGAAAVLRSHRLPSFLGRTRDFLGYWAAMATFRRPEVRLAGDRRTFEGRITNLLVSNLQWMANGVLASPRAWPEDGFVDLQVFTGPKSDSFTLLPKMFQGEHLPHPNVTEYRSRTVTVEADRALPVEADGRPLGRTPATFEVLPRILRLKV